MQSHNLDVIERALNGRSGVSVMSDATAIGILTAVAESVLKWMSDKSYTYEDQTYNLSDSVGCAIYKKGVLIRMFIPARQASGPSRITYHKLTYYESGRQSLEAALNNRSVAMLGDYTLGVYAAMPYGLWVDQSLGDGGDNKRGKGWFSGPGGLKDFAFSEFNRIKDEFIRNK